MSVCSSETLTLVLAEIYKLSFAVVRRHGERGLPFVPIVTLNTARIGVRGPGVKVTDASTERFAREADFF